MNHHQATRTPARKSRRTHPQVGRTPSLSKKKVVALAETLAAARCTGSAQTPLAARIIRMAEALAGNPDAALTADDLLGAVALRLIDQAAQFSGQTEAYVLRACRWHALHVGETELRRHAHEAPAPLLIDDDGEVIDWEELIADPAQGNPENVLIARQEAQARREFAEAVLAGVPARTQAIARGLAAGRTPGQIARQMRVTPPVVSHALTHIAEMGEALRLG